MACEEGTRGQCSPADAQPAQQAAPPTPGWAWRAPFLPARPTTAAGPAGAAAQQAPPAQPHPATPGLGTHRVVSSIPRSSSAGPPGCPANHEAETGADAASGRWVYPSEKMFFDAMRRKGQHGARAADMRVVVPIHNAVNEKAWAEIKAWEAPYAGGGPGR